MQSIADAPASDDESCTLPMGICALTDAAEALPGEMGSTEPDIQSNPTRFPLVQAAWLACVGALLGIFSGRIWAWLVLSYHAYEHAALVRPLITKSATSGVAYLVGDILAQYATNRCIVPGERQELKLGLNRARVLRSTAAGLPPPPSPYLLPVLRLPARW
jgi:hypothetical protein